VVVELGFHGYGAELETLGLGKAEVKGSGSFWYNPWSSFYNYHYYAYDSPKSYNWLPWPDQSFSFYICCSIRASVVIYVVRKPKYQLQFLGFNFCYNSIHKGFINYYMGDVLFIIVFR
jgi:hypothetical protein